jgi:hypothetical protein
MQHISDKKTNSVTAHEYDVTEVYIIDYYVTTKYFKSAVTDGKVLLIGNEA